VTLFADVMDPTVVDLITNNNTASASFFVTNVLPGMFEITNLSDQVFNPQTGLVEQRVRVTNIGTNAAASVRVMAYNFGARNRLFNAVGTNVVNTNTAIPFVRYGHSLNINESVDMLIEFFLRDRQPRNPFTNYIAAAGPAVDLSTTVTNAVAAGNTFRLPDEGGVLVEFRSTPGKSYTVLYTDNTTYTNRAEPSIVAPANVVQWIDAGPPKTLSFPDTNRIYRVLLNP
jgi:hypothetical protein